MAITIDTHALVWYLDQSLNNRLSQKALKAISEAESEDIIYLSTIVLMELLYLCEKGKVTLNFIDTLNKIEQSENYRIVSFDVDLLKIAKDLAGLEAHDRLILATAIKTGSPLVSKDKELRQANVSVIW